MQSYGLGNQKSTVTKTDTMSLVNLAARQRMLSQRMVLQTVLAAGGDMGNLQAAQKSYDLFSESQTRLRATIGEFEPVTAKLVKDTYDGPNGVGAIIEKFMQQISRTLKCIETGSTQTAAVLSTLVTSADGILSALNTATTTFDVIAKGQAELLMKELTTIVSDIQRVSREAKMLSFNAQVMAARAGQNGREFAVVANMMCDITAEIDRLSRNGVELTART